MKDQFVKNPSLLQGQPKKSVGDYVESKGILVPQRFDTLKEARASKKKILLRSEHLQDYSGISGLLESYLLDHFDYVNGTPFINAESLEEVKDIFFEIEDKSIKKYKPLKSYKEFCKYNKISFRKFRKQTSFSAWEYLEGYNRKVIADSSIPNRWHILTLGKPGVPIVNYSVFDEKTGLRDFYQDHQFKLTSNLIKGVSTLIGIYETVRNLGKFDSLNCPIMEFQTVKNKNYFLQYLRSRDFSEASFVLNRKPKANELEVAFVRGATKGENGIICKTLVKKNSREIVIPESFICQTYNPIYMETTINQRKLDLLENLGGLTGAFQGVVNGHDGTTNLFKPEVSVILISIEQFKFIVPSKTLSYKNKEDMYITLGIISDGRKAYLRRID
jgi:hypothetical protein